MILDRLRQRFQAALSLVAGQLSQAETAFTKADAESYASMVRPTSDPQFGDYQANCAMPLAKRFGKPPREVAAALVTALDVDEFCHPPEVAGPGFINLRLRDPFIAESALRMLGDQRLGVGPTSPVLRILIDFSSPNVAKPMHVGHIRSTVIGDALARTFRFMGHEVITDNHLGDWGTQFGMVIYGFKHFGDEESLQTDPVTELSRLYRLVNRVIGYHNAVAELPVARQAAAEASAATESARQAVASGEPAAAKKNQKALTAAVRKESATTARVAEIEASLAVARADTEFIALASAHREIATSVLTETAKLHRGDSENLALWQRFLPHCRDEIDRVYRRLDVDFDHTLGESFYHDMLAGVVTRLRQAGLASDSEGAVCVFLDGFDAPMIVQKKDGAYLYATTDLATLFYRQQRFSPDEILYVVDTRQGEHFEKLFAVADRLGLSDLRLRHVNFGTVLGADGRPFKTRSGASVGLESLLDEAVARASAVVCDPERSAKLTPPLDADELRSIADAVGHGAIKYADLAHHRSSDYRFDLEKMVSLEGNTSAYVQYAYARVNGIMSKGGVDIERIADDAKPPVLDAPAERNLALTLLRFGECLEQVRADYAPNFLVDYLYDTAKAYAIFNDSCPVLKAGDETLTKSRLVLVALTARVLRQGLELLGIKVIPRM